MKKREDQNKYFLGLAIRLILTILLAVNSLIIFYTIFRPLTTYSSFWLIKLFYPIRIQGNSFLYADYIIVLIDACIAGAAYYLLALFNLTTKGIKIKTRIMAYLFGAVSFLILNVLRIVILTLILFGIGSHTFNQIHLTFWILGSTVFVAGIWILTTKVFKIKEIPIYSDILEVLNLFPKSKKSKKIKSTNRGKRNK